MKWWNKWRNSRGCGCVRAKILYLSHTSVSTITYTCRRAGHFLYLNTGSSSYFAHSAYLFRWCTRFGVFFLIRNTYKQRRMKYKKGKILFSNLFVSSSYNIILLSLSNVDLIILRIYLYAIFCLDIFSRTIIWCRRQKISPTEYFVDETFRWKIIIFFSFLSPSEQKFKSIS
jgi:hypothetical protein